MIYRGCSAVLALLAMMVALTGCGDDGLRGRNSAQSPKPQQPVPVELAGQAVVLAENGEGGRDGTAYYEWAETVSDMSDTVSEEAAEP
ncbi:MAG: hypothetical protein ACLFV3_02020 [Phycisphaeraceae bacterium]